ncbi:MAG: LacI family DNA-binding transcriptional regulator [Capnocytophaga sp.]|nr:LacI family DNA-binding transcriptional regulator [Capnocytophaga sp.]
MKPITLKDLAERLGVSVTTISKALKDYPDIGKETKDQVKQLAKELNYKPNIHAVTLRSQKSKTLGVIVPKLDHHFFSQVLNGIISEANLHGYLVITLFSDDSIEKEKEQVGLLIDKRVDGVLMALSNETLAYDQDHIMEILAHNIHLVLFDRISSTIPCSKVHIDDQKAAFNAVNHLLANGAKTIAYIGGPTLPMNYRKRLNGYKQALNAWGIQEKAEFIFHSEPDDINSAYQFTLDILRKHPEIDGIFAATDILAVGALNALTDAGKSIPDEVSIIGFSNWFVTQHMRPSLSSVEQPSISMGQKAVSIMIDEINKTDKHILVQQQSVQLPTQLILRNSTKN